MSNKVVILSGIPGSGKSTLAQSLRVTPDVVVCSADDLFVENGVYRFDLAKLGHAHRACWRKFQRALQDGLELVVVDNTNLSAAEIAPYVLPAEAWGYQVEIVRVHCDPAVAFARQTHGVPAEGFARMVEAFNKRDVMPWWSVEDVDAARVKA